MKYLFPIIIFLLVGCDDDREIDATEVPKDLRMSFLNEHPAAMNVEWEFDDACYEVEFEENDVDKEIKYNVNGKVIEYHSEISSDELPKQAQTYIAENYTRAEIEEVDEVDGEEIQGYEVEIEYEATEMELYFDREGNFLVAEPE